MKKARSMFLLTVLFAFCLGTTSYAAGVNAGPFSITYPNNASLQFFPYYDGQNHGAAIFFNNSQAAGVTFLPGGTIQQHYYLSGNSLFGSINGNTWNPISSIGSSGNTGGTTSGNTGGTTSGQSLYAQYCASCHGSGSSSNKAGATASRIQSAISQNMGGMGSLSFLTSSQIDSIASYLQSLSSGTTGGNTGSSTGGSTGSTTGGNTGGTTGGNTGGNTSGNTGSSASGQSLYAQYCASCHGSGSSSNKAGATASRIQNAISWNVGGMGSLSFLTSSQINSIATYLQSINGGNGSDDNGSDDNGGNDNGGDDNKSENSKNDNNKSEDKDGKHESKGLKSLAETDNNTGTDNDHDGIDDNDEDYAVYPNNATLQFYPYYDGQNHGIVIYYNNSTASAITFSPGGSVTGNYYLSGNKLYYSQDGINWSQIQ